MRILGVDPRSSDVPHAATRALLDGGLVAFPTDTYYALGAVATNAGAVARVFAAERFWPGALTIVSRRAPYLPPALTGGRDTIGVRQPRCALAIGLCRAVGAPLVGTSANTHGQPAPVSAAEVALDLGASVDVILDGGRCPGARPSTIVDVTQTPPRIVRAGLIGPGALREVLPELQLVGS